MGLTYPFVVGSYTVPSPWVGSPYAHGGGISFANLDAATGGMYLERTIPELNPSFLRVDRERSMLWVTTEPEHGGSLLTFRLGAQGAAELLGSLPTGADAPCHMDIDHERGLVSVSHFHGGVVTVLPLDAGGVGREPIARLAAPIRVDGRDLSELTSRPHAATWVRRAELLVTDTGRDLLMLFGMRGGADFELVDTLALRRGTGPRHMAWVEATSTVYVSNQEAGSLGVIRLEDSESGPRLRHVHEMETRGVGRAQPRPSEVVVHPNGRIVYMANRVDDSLSVFEIDADAERVDLLASVEVVGSNPRHFGVTPDGRFLLVANAVSDDVVSFRAGADGRELEWTGERLELATPNFIAV